MIIADWIVLGLLVLFALIGFLLGFGKVLRIFTSGFFGVIIAIFVCYYFGGLIYQIGFVNSLLNSFLDTLNNSGTVCQALAVIRLDLIVYYVILFIIVMIIRAIVVKIIAGIAEIDNVVVKFINRIFGLILFVVIMVFISLAVFRLIYVIGGSTSETFSSYFTGSKLRLDWLYENNPLLKISVFKITKTIPVTQ